MDYLKDLCKEVLPDYEILTYGSYATNLALKWSDLDLILGSKTDTPDPLSLRTFYNSLASQKWIKTHKFIENTSVPIVKLTAVSSLGNVQIDISLKDSKHFGLRCIKLVNSFLQEYPSLVYIVLALKQILKYCDLNDPFKGGISSYGLILMIVFFLQNYRSIYNIGSNSSVNFSNYGRVFCEFLDYYGNYFDNSKYW
eukprot:CAMPEP_0170523012 /NCGR_PEP_ID=MMETSP0209-20121228/8406_1 /TAXON_ID=665100 ORGANISM="Litonotus pictus, Strain P1" /NCGR_SAMPLE_ID=MMETSP0209 /ASSEMBLY_ACC=CAM_ASM_000301 /LENGTH=196 /DNA_ID=CAMNT_0010810823 /DNA_START=181 /DNA_END=768 /DNA_ORIENTATION=-